MTERSICTVPAPDTGLELVRVELLPLDNPQL